MVNDKKTGIYFKNMRGKWMDFKNCRITIHVLHIENMKSEISL